MTNKEAIVFLSEFQQKHMMYGKAHERCMDISLSLAIKALENEPKKGKWIERNSVSPHCVYFQCNMCGTTKKYTHNFCPNCGADMREVENGS